MRRPNLPPARMRVIRYGSKIWKICNHCLKCKPAVDFHQAKNEAGQLYGRCLECEGK